MRKVLFHGRWLRTFQVLCGTVHAVSLLQHFVCKKTSDSYRERIHIMTNASTQQAETGNMIKDPDDWKTGDEPMTGAQRSYLKTLSDEAGADFDGNLTKAEAAKRIEELQQITGRGLDQSEQRV